MASLALRATVATSQLLRGLAGKLLGPADSPRSAHPGSPLQVAAEETTGAQQPSPLLFPCSARLSQSVQMLTTAQPSARRPSGRDSIDSGLANVPVLRRGPASHGSGSSAEFRPGDAAGGFSDVSASPVFCMDALTVPLTAPAAAAAPPQDAATQREAYSFLHRSPGPFTVADSQLPSSLQEPVEICLHPPLKVTPLLPQPAPLLTSTARVTVDGPPPSVACDVRGAPIGTSSPTAPLDAMSHADWLVEQAQPSFRCSVTGSQCTRVNASQRAAAAAAAGASATPRGPPRTLSPADFSRHTSRDVVEFGGNSGNDFTGRGGGGFAYTNSSLLSTLHDNMPNRTWRSRCLDYERLRQHVHEIIQTEVRTTAVVADGLLAFDDIRTADGSAESNALSRATFRSLVSSEWDKVTNFVVEQEHIVSKALDEWMELAQQLLPPSAAQSICVQPPAVDGCPPQGFPSCYPVLKQADLVLLEGQSPTVRASVGKSTHPSSASGGSCQGGIIRSDGSCNGSQRRDVGNGNSSSASVCGGKHGRSPSECEKSTSKAATAMPPRKRIKGDEDVGDDPLARLRTLDSCTPRHGSEDTSQQQQQPREANMAKMHSAPPSSPARLARTLTYLLQQLVVQTKGVATSVADIAAANARVAGVALGQISSNRTSESVVEGSNSVVHQESDLLLCRKFLAIATLADYLRQFVLLNYLSLWRLLREYAVHTQRHNTVSAIWHDLQQHNGAAGAAAAAAADDGTGGAAFAGRIFAELWHRLLSVSEQLFLVSLDKLVAAHRSSRTRVALSDVSLTALTNYDPQPGVPFTYRYPLDESAGLRSSVPLDQCGFCVANIVCPIGLPCGHRMCLVCWTSSPSCGVLCPVCMVELRVRVDAELSMGWMQGLSLFHLQKQRLRPQEMEHKLQRTRSELGHQSSEQLPLPQSQPAYLPHRELLHLRMPAQTVHVSQTPQLSADGSSPAPCVVPMSSTDYADSPSGSLRTVPTPAQSPPRTLASAGRQFSGGQMEIDRGAVTAPTNEAPQAAATDATRSATGCSPNATSRKRGFHTLPRPMEAHLSPTTSFSHTLSASSQGVLSYVATDADTTNFASMSPAAIDQEQSFSQHVPMNPVFGSPSLPGRALLPFESPQLGICSGTAGDLSSSPHCCFSGPCMPNGCLASGISIPMPYASDVAGSEPILPPHLLFSVYEVNRGAIPTGVAGLRPCRGPTDWKRNQGYSCHHCKATKPIAELLLCTNATSVSKSCRKKFCLACLRRLYPPDMQQRDVDPIHALTEGGYGWRCPSCCNRCVCASCGRKSKAEAEAECAAASRSSLTQPIRKRRRS